MKNVDYAELKKSEKFTPALYHEKDGIWEGGKATLGMFKQQLTSSMQ